VTAAKERRRTYYYRDFLHHKGAIFGVEKEAAARTEEKRNQYRIILSKRVPGCIWGAQDPSIRQNARTPKKARIPRGK